MYETEAAEDMAFSRYGILMQNRSMIQGYAHVSTPVHDLISQLAQLKTAGCEKVFREKITDTTAGRPQLKNLMGALANGEVMSAGRPQTLHFRLMSEALSGMGKHLSDAIIELVDAKFRFDPCTYYVER